MQRSQHRDGRSTTPTNHSPAHLGVSRSQSAADNSEVAPRNNSILGAISRFFLQADWLPNIQFFQWLTDYSIIWLKSQQVIVWTKRAYKLGCIMFHWAPQLAAPRHRESGSLMPLDALSELRNASVYIPRTYGSRSIFNRSLKECDRPSIFYADHTARTMCKNTSTYHPPPPLPPNPPSSAFCFENPPPRVGLDCAASCLRSSSGTRDIDDFINICLRSYL